MPYCVHCRHRHQFGPYPMQSKTCENVRTYLLTIILRNHARSEPPIHFVPMSTLRLKCWRQAMQSLPRSSSTRGAEELRFRTMQSVLGSIHPSRRYLLKNSLAEVELCEGLVENGFRELRPFQYENQHPHITQKDWRLCLLEISTNCYYSSQRWY